MFFTAFTEVLKEHEAFPGYSIFESIHNSSSSFPPFPSGVVRVPDPAVVKYMEEKKLAARAEERKKDEDERKRKEIIQERLIHLEMQRRRRDKVR